MLSYHNDPKVKEKYETRFAAHREADEVVQGLGFDNGRGCFVGCTLNKYDHTQFPVELGWPEWLARLADSIFENTPKELAPQFGTDLLAAVPVGADLEPVKYTLSLRRLQKTLTLISDNHADVKTAITGVITLLEQEISSPKSVTDEQWSAAWSAARAAAAWSAAWAAEAAAESAAWKEERDFLLVTLRELTPQTK